MSDPFKAITSSIESNRRFFVKHKVQDAKENLRTSQQHRLLANVVGSHPLSSKAASRTDSGYSYAVRLTRLPAGYAKQAHGAPADAMNHTSNIPGSVVNVPITPAVHLAINLNAAAEATVQLRMAVQQLQLSQGQQVDSTSSAIDEIARCLHSAMSGLGLGHYWLDSAAATLFWARQNFSQKSHGRSLLLDSPAGLSTPGSEALQPASAGQSPTADAVAAIYQTACDDFDLPAQTKLKRVLQTLAPALLHSHRELKPSGFVPLLLCLVAGTKLEAIDATESGLDATGFGFITTAIACTNSLSVLSPVQMQALTGAILRLAKHARPAPSMALKLHSWIPTSKGQDAVGTLSQNGAVRERPRLGGTGVMSDSGEVKSDSEEEGEEGEEVYVHAESAKDDQEAEEGTDDAVDCSTADSESADGGEAADGIRPLGDGNLRDRPPALSRPVHASAFTPEVVFMRPPVRLLNLCGAVKCGLSGAASSAKVASRFGQYTHAFLGPSELATTNSVDSSQYSTLDASPRTGALQLEWATTVAGLRALLYCNRQLEHVSLARCGLHAAVLHACGLLADDMELFVKSLDVSSAANLHSAQHTLLPSDRSTVTQAVPTTSTRSNTGSPPGRHRQLGASKGLPSTPGRTPTRPRRGSGAGKPTRPMDLEAMTLRTSLAQLVNAGGFSIRYMNLSHVPLHGAVSAVWHALSRGVSGRLPIQQTLTKLVLSHSGLTDEDMTDVLTGLPDSALETLDLSFNPLGPQTGQAMAVVLRGQSRLRSLNLDGTSIGFRGGLALLLALAFNRSLLHLGLACQWTKSLTMQESSPRKPGAAKLQKTPNRPAAGGMGSSPMRRVPKLRPTKPNLPQSDHDAASTATFNLDDEIQLVYEVASAAVAERKEPCDWHVEYPQRPRLATKLTTDLATVAQMLRGMVPVARGRSQQAESGESLREAVLAFLQQIREAQAEPWAPSRSVFRGRETGGLGGADGTTSSSNIKLELPALLRTHLQCENMFARRRDRDAVATTLEFHLGTLAHAFHILSALSVGRQVVAGLLLASPEYATSPIGTRPRAQATASADHDALFGSVELVVDHETMVEWLHEIDCMQLCNKQRRRAHMDNSSLAPTAHVEVNTKDPMQIYSMAGFIDTVVNLSMLSRALRHGRRPTRQTGSDSRYGAGQFSHVGSFAQHQEVGSAQPGGIDSLLDTSPDAAVPLDLFITEVIAPWLHQAVRTHKLAVGTSSQPYWSIPIVTAPATATNTSQPGRQPPHCTMPLDHEGLRQGMQHTPEMEQVLFRIRRRLRPVFEKLRLKGELYVPAAPTGQIRTGLQAVRQQSVQRVQIAEQQQQPTVDTGSEAKAPLLRRRASSRRMLQQAAVDMKRQRSIRQLEDQLVNGSEGTGLHHGGSKGIGAMDHDDTRQRGPPCVSLYAWLTVLYRIHLVGMDQDATSDTDSLADHVMELSPTHPSSTSTSDPTTRSLMQSARDWPQDLRTVFDLVVHAVWVFVHAMAAPDQPSIPSTARTLLAGASPSQATAHLLTYALCNTSATRGGLDELGWFEALVRFYTLLAPTTIASSPSTQSTTLPPISPDDTSPAAEASRDDSEEVHVEGLFEATAPRQPDHASSDAQTTQMVQPVLVWGNMFQQLKQHCIQAFGALPGYIVGPHDQIVVSTGQGYPQAAAAGDTIGRHLLMPKAAHYRRIRAGPALRSAALEWQFHADGSRTARVTVHGREEESDATRSRTQSWSTWSGAETASTAAESACTGGATSGASNPVEENATRLPAVMIGETASGSPAESGRDERTLSGSNVDTPPGLRFVAQDVLAFLDFLLQECYWAM